MTGTRRTILLCCDQRLPRCADRDTGLASWNRLMALIERMGLDVEAKKQDCFRVCRDGPIACVLPEKTWYGRCTPDGIERVVREHLAEGRIVEDLVFEGPSHAR